MPSGRRAQGTMAAFNDDAHYDRLCFQIPLATHGERFMERGTEAFLKEKKKIVGNSTDIHLFYLRLLVTVFSSHNSGLYKIRQAF